MHSRGLLHQLAGTGPGAVHGLEYRENLAGCWRSPDRLPASRAQALARPGSVRGE